MRWLGVLVLSLFLGAGLVIGYLFYRQLDTGIVRLDAAPDLQRTASGLCGQVDLSVGGRTLGRWVLPLEEGQTVSVTVRVGGDEANDIGFAVWSPVNDLVYSPPRRIHEDSFEFVAPMRGEYIFDIDNRHSTLTGKRVTFDLCLS